MRYKMLNEKLLKLANTKAAVGHIATVYRVQSSSFQQWPRQRMSTSSLPAEAKKQPRLANLRSQLPLANMISSTPSQTSDIDTSSELSNTKLENRKTSKRSRSLRPYIYACLFFAVGSVAGNFVCSIVVPRASPEPDSPEDIMMVKYLHKQAENLPLVKLLSSDSLWSPVEISTAKEKENDNDTLNQTNELKIDELKETLQRRLSIGPLGGSRALGGYQKMFRNLQTGEIIKIFWLGPGISGWPGVAHGGVLATILDETLGRCAMGFLVGHTGVTANLQLHYLKPVLTNGFYIIRTTAKVEDEDQVNEKKIFSDRVLKRKQSVTGTLEDTAGEICVEAKALFVVPKNYQLKTLDP